MPQAQIPNYGAGMGPLYIAGGTYSFPHFELPSGKIIDSPHAEWALNHLRWRWLVDSWEGGDVYRTATYGYDMKGMPIRNMIRHKREYPSSSDRTWSPFTGRPPGTDQYNQATDDDYELRRARTPVPGFVAEVVERHISKIYKREPRRSGPAPIELWWEDVDGKQTSIGDWMEQVVAPLLLVLGQLDVVLDHPTVPEGETVKSRADEYRLRLGDVVASYLLPENVFWWCLDIMGRYEEILIREVSDDQAISWRYWNKEVWCLYDSEGNMEEGPVNHDYGIVPILRIFDRRRPRCRNVGLPRYEMIAEQQREYYNRDSELILSDTTQAHPLLQGPEDYVQSDGTIAVGPNWMLPKKKNMSGGAASYEGFDVIQFPKDGAESIRMNLDRLRDAVDRMAGLTKPAGAQGSTGGTVSQSGISKQLDAVVGHDLLGNISKTLQRAEEAIADAFWVVRGDGDPDVVAMLGTSVQYPQEFDLQSADDLADMARKYTLLIGSAGESPLIQGKMLSTMVKTAVPGLDDEEYRAMADEITAILARGPKQPEPRQEDEEQEQEQEPGGVAADNGEVTD